MTQEKKQGNDHKVVGTQELKNKRVIERVIDDVIFRAKNRTEVVSYIMDGGVDFYLWEDLWDDDYREEVEDYIAAQIAKRKSWGNFNITIGRYNSCHPMTWGVKINFEEE